MVVGAWLLLVLLPSGAVGGERRGDEARGRLSWLPNALAPPGGKRTLHMTFANDGPDTAAVSTRTVNREVANASVLSIDASQGSCRRFGDLFLYVICDLGELAEGETATVDMVVRVPHRCSRAVLPGRRGITRSRWWVGGSSLGFFVQATDSTTGTEIPVLAPRSGDPPRFLLRIKRVNLGIRSAREPIPAACRASKPRPRGR